MHCSAMTRPEFSYAWLIALLAIDEDSSAQLSASNTGHFREHELVANEIHERAALARRHDEDQLQPQCARQVLDDFTGSRFVHFGERLIHQHHAQMVRTLAVSQRRGDA